VAATNRQNNSVVVCWRRGAVFVPNIAARSRVVNSS
jgi:hypothetical protein